MSDLVIDGYRLEMTSMACPEQYDVFDVDGTQVGYLRLRHGYFRADYPDCGGETVYETATKGDGIFDEDERVPQLKAAIAALRNAHLNDGSSRQRSRQMITIPETYIPLDQCIDRGVYRIKSRNLDVGVYCAKNRGFIGIRTKFGEPYLFKEYHWDTGEPFGTVRPIKQIGVLPDDIECDELIWHKYGDSSFAQDPVAGGERAVVRRQLGENEASHGQRMGFVDEWADTKERLPVNVWPYVKENAMLMKFLAKISVSDE